MIRMIAAGARVSCILLMLGLSYQWVGAATFTSATSGDWDDGATWGNSSPGTQGVDWPDNTDDVIIATGHTVTITADEDIANVTIQTGGILIGSGGKLLVSGNFTTQGTGYFSMDDELDVVGLVTIGGTSACTQSHKCDFHGGLVIDAGASLTQTTTGNQNLELEGNLTINGTLSLNDDDKKIKWDGSGTDTLDGTGTISTDDFTSERMEWKNGNRVIASSADITVNCVVGLDETITNNGTIEFNYDVDERGGAGVNATWTQGANSTVKFGADIFSSGGTLNASATGNTVEYDKAGAQTIFQASSNQYYNLTITGTGSKTTTVDYNLDGDLTINASATFDPGGDNITIAGDVVNNGTLTVGTGSSTFTFDGTSTISGSSTSNFHNVTITGTLTGHATDMNIDGNWNNSGGVFSHNSGTVTFNGSVASTIDHTGSGSFYDLTLNHSAASSAVTLNNGITVDGTLTFTDGHLVTSSANLLTIGTGGSVSGADDASHVNGPVAKNTNSTSTFRFPIGTGTVYRRLEIVPTSSSATTFEAQYFAAEQAQGSGLSGVDHISREEYWELDRTSGSANTAVVLSWDSNSGVDDLADILVAQWNSSNWISNGNASTTGTISDGTVTSNTVSSFTTKYFTLGSSTSDNPLAEKRYSVATGNWNVTSTWASSSGGSPGASVPTSDTYVVIEGSDVVTLVGAVTVKGLEIESGSSLTMGSNKLTVTSSMDINGTITGSEDIDFSGQSFDGDGSMTLTAKQFNFLTDGAEIQSTADFTFNNDIKFDVNDIDITNSGTVTVTGKIQENNTGNVWINGTNATLNIAGSLLADNQVTASATGNTINYNGSVAQTIIAPTSGQYYNLTLSTSNTKTLGSHIDIDGTLTISGTASYDPANFNTTLEGNFVNNGSMVTGTGGGTFTFDGTTTISGTGTPNFHNVTISGALTGHASNTMNVDGSWTDNGTYTHNSGTVDFTGTTTISGSATTNFNNVTISSTLTGSTGQFNVAGNWVNNGTFTHNSGTVGFNGTTTISGSSTTSFGGVEITGSLTGPSSGTINVAGNWNNNSGTWTHNSGTVVFNGSSQQTFSNTGSGNFNDVTINNSTADDGIVQSGSATIDGTLTFTDGHILASGSDYFTISTSGNYTGEDDDSHVKGKIAVQSNSTSAIVFPVGGYGSYRPITVTPASSTATTYVGAYFRDDHGLGNTVDTGLDHVSNWEYWEVDRTSGSANATFILTWDNNSVVDDLIDLRVVHWDGAEWDDVGSASTTGTTASGTITSNTITSFSTKYFTLGSTTTDNPLSNYRFSVATGDWTNSSTWAYRSGGASGASEPSGDNWVFIEGGYTVTMDADGGVNQDVTIETGSRLDGGGGKLTIGGDLTTEGTGYFSLDDELDVTGLVTIGGTSACTQSHKCDFHGGLTIDAGASLTQTTAGNQNLELEGDLTINGTLALNDNDKEIKWDGASAATLYGTGTITTDDLTTSRMEWKNGDKTIDASANITVNCLVQLDDNITNNGTIEFNYAVDEAGGAGVNAIWTQGDNSTVKFGDDVFASGGTLNASATGNTVEFDKAGSQTVFEASGNQYYNLTLSGSGSKTTAVDFDVDGDITISGTADFNVGTDDITLAGNLVNNGSMTVGTGASTFTFNGNSTISGSGTTNLHNVTIAGTLTGHSGTFNVDGNWVNNAAYNHNSGTVLFNGTTTLSGSSTTSFHNVSINGSSTLTGVSSGNFNVAGNFSNAGTFTHNSGTVTFNGSSAQSITGGVATTFNGLTVANTSTGLTLDDPTTYIGYLNLVDGIVATDATNLLIAADNATTSSGSSDSFVDGPMKKIGNDNFTFPIGDGTVWARLELDNSASGNTTTEFTAEYNDGGYFDNSVDVTLNNVSNIEYWSVSRAVNADAPTLGLHWEDAGRSVIDTYTSDLVVARYDGTDWTDEGQIALVGTTAGMVRSTSVSDFSNLYFTFGSLSDGGNPLPEGLVSFDAKLKGDKVELEWVTASEVNNETFTVEKTVDGIHFETVTTQPGAGNSTSLIRYTDDDLHPYIGKSYYRLKLTNYDGSESFSRLESIIYEGDFPVNVYPNPFHGDALNIRMAGIQGQELDLLIYNQLGEMVYARTIREDEGPMNVKLTLDQRLSPGVYFLSGIAKQHSFNRKLIVK